MKNALIIFVRKPELGKVKTRLAATLGREKALEIYRELLTHTLAIATKTEAHKYVFYADNIEKEDDWNGDGFYKRLQSNGDLGHKMKEAFSQLFEQGYQQIIVIGSDCFELTTSHIEDAFSALHEKDTVIGPANDGGYYLLGMKKLYTFLFENKQWSTETVFSDTLQEFKENNLSYSLLPVLTDVDTEEDWLATKK